MRAEERERRPPQTQRCLKQKIGTAKDIEGLAPLSNLSMCLSKKGDLTPQRNSNETKERERHPL
jgi:hypothetical protein